MKTKNKILLIFTIVFFILYLLSSCKDEGAATPEPAIQNTGTPCSGLSSLEYGGQTYHTIQIANQCWMRENLNIGTFILSGDTLKNNDTIEKYCYNDVVANCNKYGGMYNWNELMSYNDSVAQGICPNGWHIPTDLEWATLEAGLDSLYTISDSIWGSTGWRGFNAGGKMKMSGLDDWYNPNIGAQNSVGFTAVPAGIRYHDNLAFDKIKSANYLWSSTKVGESDAWFRLLSYAHADIKRAHTHFENAFSVRCLKDN
ncbi:MAG: fibrobacter succinogenes major paralogous domain-containing protein [Bacteroidales bacterium]|nr:fibrobacter succinogenes major paralogous domain-containing protein [Bacteroidales bacterium]